MMNFVASFEPAQGLPYLADVAALEWACIYTRNADWCIPAIRSPRAGKLISPALKPIFSIDLDSGPCNALVSRKDDVVLVNELTDADTAWFQYMQGNTRFEEETVATLGRYPDFDLQAALLKLAAQNVITNFTPGEEV
jgi:hypothetical protein